MNYFESEIKRIGCIAGIGCEIPNQGDPEMITPKEFVIQFIIDTVEKSHNPIEELKIDNRLKEDILFLYEDKFVQEQVTFKELIIVCLIERI